MQQWSRTRWPIGQYSILPDAFRQSGRDLMVGYRTHPDTCTSISLPFKYLLVWEKFSFGAVISTDHSRQACYVMKSPSKTEPALKTLPKHKHSKQWVKWRKIEHRNSYWENKDRSRTCTPQLQVLGMKSKKSRKFISTPFFHPFPRISNIFELRTVLFSSFDLPRSTLHHGHGVWPSTQEIQHLGSVYRHLGLMGGITRQLT